MKVAIYSDPGKVRPRNEDCCGAKENIFIIADGMGGHLAGEIAATMAVNKILSEYKPGMSLNDVKELIYNTNTAIFELAKKDEQYTGMGTTISVLIISDENYSILHVGDSRVYSYNGLKLSQLTSDHSIVGELVRNGSITEGEAKTHPQRNVLTRALGTADDLEVDIVEEKLHPGEFFLLCTDGLFGVVNTEEMEIILARQDKTWQEKAEMLVKLANEKGGPDNITVMLAGFKK